MSYYQQINNVVAVCVHCERQYVVGKTGTVMGCDECLKVERNPLDGTIIEDRSIVEEEAATKVTRS